MSYLSHHSFVKEIIIFYYSEQGGADINCKTFVGDMRLFYDCSSAKTIGIDKAVKNASCPILEYARNYIRPRRKFAPTGRYGGSSAYGISVLVSGNCRSRNPARSEVVVVR